MTIISSLSISHIPINIIFTQQQIQVKQYISQVSKGANKCKNISINIYCRFGHNRQPGLLSDLFSVTVTVSTHGDIWETLKCQLKSVSMNSGNPREVDGGKVRWELIPIRGMKWVSQVSKDCCSYIQSFRS